MAQYGSAIGTETYSAMDLPCDSQGVHQVGKCRVCNVHLTDCGLIWTDYPSLPKKEKKARSNKKKRPAAQQREMSDAEGALLASQLEQLGLPAGFGTSKGACGEETDSGLEYYAEAEEDSQEGVTSACEDLCTECESNVDLNSAAPQQDGASDWQQAYDHTYGCLYYYCERTQETQWEPPADGYLPIPIEWLPSPDPNEVTQLTTATELAEQPQVHAAPTSMQDMVPQTATQLQSGDQHPTLTNAAGQTQEGQQQTQAASILHLLLQSEGDLSEQLSAAHLSPDVAQQGTERQQANGSWNDHSHTVHDMSLTPKYSRGTVAARPESSGLMTSIPEPQGTHLRFDSDSDAQQCCSLSPVPRHDVESPHQMSRVTSASIGSLHDTLKGSLQGDTIPGCSSLHSHKRHVSQAIAMQPDSTAGDQSSGTTVQAGIRSIAHQPDNAQLPDAQAEPSDTTAAQQAVHSIMSSTVVTAEAIQQDTALSNIALHDPTHLQSALQSLAETPEAVAVLTSAQDNLQASGLDTDMLAIDGGDETLAGSDQPGITFQSLSNQAQSKQELPRKLWKYWLQRYSLFQRFDEGILMDEEGWYSATPEVIAAHQATKCRCSVIVDAFAGVGGNSIQFALTCDKVIAVELSAQRLAIARHNAEVYGVADKIHFICGNFLALAPTLQADIVFLSPPWGGPAYSKSGLFDVAQSIGGLGQNLGQLLQTASAALTQSASQNIACFLPRNTDLLALSDTVQLQECIVERNVLNGHLKAVTAYYGDLAGR